MGFVLQWVNESNLFLGILAFMWIVYVWQEYLKRRQKCVVKQNEIASEEVQKIMTIENYNKARLYSLDKLTFTFYHELFNMVESTIILCCNILPYSWVYSLSLVTESDKITESDELKASLVFIFIWLIYNKIIGLPWEVYGVFVLEEKHGFNKQTVKFFIKDQIKALVLTVVLMLPIMYGLLYIIKRGGPHFYVYAWLFAFIVMIFFMFIYPEFIAPLFDKYVLLPDGELKDAIELQASGLNFPLTKVFVVEGSKRSSHSNAYFYGFWKNKRIVLFDTLLKGFKMNPEDENDCKKEKEGEDKGCTNEEILSVLGHELGHWKLNHTLQQIVVSQVNMFLMFFTFGLLTNMDILFRAFGFVGMVTPTIVKLMLIVNYMMSPYHFLLGIVQIFWSRKNEFQADKFAFDLGYGEKLSSALIKLQNDNLGFPVYDKLYSMFNLSHPPVLERTEAINNLSKKC